MGSNTRALKASPDPKKPAKPKDIIYDPEGQWKFPGQITKIPGGRITMQGISYPLLGVDNNGNEQMMLPGGEYHFPGADNVTEYPQLKKGGEKDHLVKLKRVPNWRSTGDATRMNQFKEGGWLDEYSEGGDLQDINTNDGIRTWDLGHYEGKPEDAKMKKLIQEHRDNPTSIVPGGETYQEFVNRVKPAYNQALATLPDKSLIVTHSEVIKALGLPKLTPGKVHEIPVGDKTIYVGRHGDTPENSTTPGPTLVRNKDVPLAPLGVKEAEKTAKSLANKGITKIMSSTLPRAITTAEIIANTVKEELGGIVDNNQQEFRHGGGLTRHHTGKNIQSSLNRLSLRNEDLYGRYSKGIYEPYIDRKDLGGETNWLENYK